MKMRFWFEALAEPNRMAAQVLTTSPIKVRTLGLMRESASQRTMVSSRTPQARPKALVQDGAILRASLFRLVGDFVVNGAEAEDFQFALAIGGDYDDFVPYLHIEERAADRRRGRNMSRGHVGLFAGHQLVLHLFVLGAVENLDGGTEAHFVVGNVGHVDH